MGSLARIVLPIISGYFEEYIEGSSSFSIVLILMAFSIVAVCYYYYKILHYTTGIVDKDTTLSPVHYIAMAVSVGSVFLALGTISDLGAL
jgi:ABC-type transport system involved in cytochrome c biogenesis permease subunit